LRWTDDTTTSPVSAFTIPLHPPSIMTPISNSTSTTINLRRTNRSTSLDNHNNGDHEEEKRGLVLPATSRIPYGSDPDDNDTRQSIKTTTITTTTIIDMFHKHKWNSFRIWFMTRRLVVRIILCTVVGIWILHNNIFYIRYFTMSRPSWIYGSPMDVKEIEKCIIPRPRRLPSSGSSSTPSPVVVNSDGFQYDWWYSQRPTNTTTTTTSKQQQPQQQQYHTASQRLLIAQYSGYGKYSKLLDVIAPINAKYAELWGHDFVILQGTALHFNSIDPICDKDNQNARSTFNKIPLLQLAYDQRDKYDQVLILDTDAMIVNFSTDITRLLPMTHVLAAHRVWTNYDGRNTFDINAGITLWNLHHSTLPHILTNWNSLVQNNPYMVLEKNDDQYFLQWTLLQMGYWNRWVYSLTKEFQYYDATVIKHFKRDVRSWSTTSLEQRILRVQEIITELGRQQPPIVGKDLGIKFADRTRNP